VKHRLPLWIKIIYTAFVAVMLIVYFPQYGPANCLWFCDVAAILTVFALWFESSLIASSQLVSMLISQTVWIADFVSGGHLIGISEYMFNPSIHLYVRGLSTFHLWLPFLLIWMVKRLGYDRRAPWLQTAIGVVVLVASYAFSDPRHPSPKYPNVSVNVNRVYGLGVTTVQTALPETVYLALMCIGYPSLIYFPTHLLIMQIIKRRQRHAAAEEAFMSDEFLQRSVRPNERLRAARERAGIEPHEVARETGLQYYDMEDHVDELWMACSLRDIAKVCAHLHVTPRYLFDETPEAMPSNIRYAFADVADLIRRYMEAHSISFEQFGNQAGWAVEDVLTDPSNAWEWNADCLKDVCTILGINWLDGLPIRPEQ